MSWRGSGGPGSVLRELVAQPDAAGSDGSAGSTGGVGRTVRLAGDVLRPIFSFFPSSLSSLLSLASSYVNRKAGHTADHSRYRAGLGHWNRVFVEVEAPVARSKIDV